jgi:hypothetical protein
VLNLSPECSVITIPHNVGGWISSLGKWIVPSYTYDYSYLLKGMHYFEANQVTDFHLIPRTYPKERALFRDYKNKYLLLFVRNPMSPKAHPRLYQDIVRIGLG